MRAGIGPGGRLRMAILSVWMIAAAGIIADLTTSLDAVAAATALAAAVVAGLLLADVRLSLGVSMMAPLALMIWLLFGGAAPLSIVLVAVCVALTGVAAILGRSSFGQASIGLADRAAVASAADTRLPPGVADEALLDRLTIHEMTRARRYERPLTLLLIGIEGWSKLCTDRGRRTASDLLGTLAVKVRRLLRDVDAIGLHGDGRLAVLLPETPLDGALIVAGRIERLAVDDTGLKSGSERPSSPTMPSPSRLSCARLKRRSISPVSNASTRSSGPASR